MKNTKILLSGLMIGALIFSGCTPIKPIPLTNKKQFSGKQLAIKQAKEESNEPFISTAGQTVGGAVGGFLGVLIVAAMDNAGEHGKMNVTPSNYLSQQLAPLVAKKMHMKYAGYNTNNANYILYVKTPVWSVSDHNASGVGLYMNNIISLEPKSGGDSLWRVICKYQPTHFSTLEKYKANGGALMKKQTQEALNKCIRKVRSKL